MTATITGDQTGTVGLINTKTAVASTSGTSIDFTGVPAGVKRITVLFSGVSTNGTSIPQVQLGTSGGVATSGYVCTAVQISNTTPAYNTSTSGFILNTSNNAVWLYMGQMTICLVSSNTWTMSSAISIGTSGAATLSAGNCVLGGTLDRVRITTVNGTDTFDAGSINILYE